MKEIQVEGLDHEAWAIWIDYRRAIRKPLQPASWPLAMKKMAAMGDDQMEAVENSIANGYQGLFAPNGKPDTTARLTVEDLK
jgi:hypothetical protein